MAGSLLDRLGIGLGGADKTTLDLVQLTRDAESAGFRFIRVGDSGYDSMAMAGAIAMATKRIEVRTGVSLWSRTPVQTVFAAATLDGLSGGRFRLGLGPGPQERSEGWHDISYHKVVGRFRDYVKAIRAGFSSRPGKRVSYEGPFYRFKDFAMTQNPIQDPMTIDLAANGPQMLRTAGELADTVLINNIQGGKYPREVAIPTVRRGEQIAGRAPGSVRISGAFKVSIAGSKEEGIARARGPLMSMLESSYNRDLVTYYGLIEERERIEAAIASGDRQAFHDAVADEVVEIFFVCGTGDQCRENVASYGDILDEASLAVPTLRNEGEGPGTNYTPLLEVFGSAVAGAA